MPKEQLFNGDFMSMPYSCNILDKEASIFNYVMYMYDKTSSMFKYTGLPDTIPEYMLELYLQLNGHCAFTKINGNFYVFCGGLGGAPDPYYRETLYVTANPALGISKSLRILNHLDPFDKNQASQGECVLIKNDTMYRGLLYMFARYATELAENDISIRSAQINSRQQSLISAADGRDYERALAYIEDLIAGKLAAIAEKPFLDGIKVFNTKTDSANCIIQLIELQQYLKASWYNDIGLNANFNMKREYLSTEEIRAQTDTLLPLTDDMYRNRKEAVDFINKTYGTSITVEKNGAWAEKYLEIDTEQKLKESEINENNSSSDSVSVKQE